MTYHSVLSVFGLVGSGASGSPTGPVELKDFPRVVLSSDCRVWTRQTVLHGVRDSTIRGTSRSGSLDTGYLRQSRNALGSKRPCGYDVFVTVVVTLVAVACDNRVGCRPWTPNGQKCLDRVQTYQRPGGRSDMADSSAFRSFAEWHTCAGIDRQHKCHSCV